MANNFKTIYVLRFNNYYNRILKHYDTLNDYLSRYEYEAYTNINFNPGNGVSTEQILNQSNVAIDEMDYVLVVNPTYSTIESRWYILQTDRTRLGQYNLSLKRDLVADNYEGLLEAPMFIEKATVSKNDSAIYNAEDMDFNEIKSKETLLKDGTRTPWIALYLANGITEDITGEITLHGDADFDLTSVSHTGWQFYGFNSKGATPEILNVGVGFSWSNGTNLYEKINYANKNDTYYDNTTVYSGPYQYGYSGRGSYKTTQALVDAMKRNTFEYSTLLTTLTNEKGWFSNESELLNYNGKTIAFSDGIYKCDITKSTETIYEYVNPNSGDLYPAIKSQIEAEWTSQGLTWNGPGSQGFRAFRLKYTLTSYTVQLTQVIGKNQTYEYKISAGRAKTDSQPYDIVVLPFKQISFKVGGSVIYSKPDITLAVAKDIIAKNKGANKVVDAQIVPYFPEQEYIVNNQTWKIDLSNKIEGTQFDYIKLKNSSPAVYSSFCFYSTRSDFTAKISADIGGDIYTRTASSALIKQWLECDKFRLCSPNYNGVFEFNPIKAGFDSSTVQFDIDCTYMPMTPYIHVYPTFKAGSLYGNDYNDARGLICGGDFSMAMSSDAWETYKAQNKNYQLAFDREIEHLEFNQKYQKVGEILGAVSGTVQGASSGASLGSKAGPVGAAAGALIGTAVAGAAGIADVAIGDKIRKEAIDYSKDNFGYRLGNIKALPNSLVKTTAYTYNNKYFPFVEYYTCTDIEKAAFKDKLTYNGMTVMRIGTLREFIKPDETYIKGRLIRLENFPGNTQELSALASELNLGYFIKGE